MQRSIFLPAALAVVTALGAFGALAFTPTPFGPSLADAKGKPGTQAKAALSINSEDAHLGDWVTFSYTTDSKAPRIQVMCYQGTTLVYGEAGPADQSFLLGGGSSDWRWGGGEASCTATLYEWDFHPVQTFVPFAEASFSAGDWR